jgi:hypothetical protein
MQEPYDEDEIGGNKGVRTIFILNGWKKGPDTFISPHGHVRRSAKAEVMDVRAVALTLQR